MSDEKPTPEKPEEAEKTAPSAEEVPAVEAAPEEAAETAPEEAAPELEVIEGGEAEGEEAEPAEEPVPWLNHRLNPQIVEELLDFMLYRKKGQDAHYLSIEVVDIDWEKEEVNTLRHRPKPLEPSPEVFSFEFLERFRKLHEEGMDSYVIKIQ